jgi:hypothetical protein
MPPKQRAPGLAAQRRRNGSTKARVGPAHVGVPPPFYGSGWRRSNEFSPSKPFGPQPARAVLST